MPIAFGDLIMSDTIVSPKPVSSIPASLFQQANFINGAWVKEGDGSFNTVVDK